MKKIYYCIFITLAFSCNNSAEKESENEVMGNDTTFVSTPGYVKPGINPIAGRPNNEEEEIRTRRAIVYMSIDSTYFAINEIEGIKNELAATSSINLSAAERNLKSKAISKMNILQNSLARQVDSALLVNLKMHTRELASINNSITDDVVHLKNLSQQLSRVAGIMNQVTNVLTICVSKGLIKPPTPIKANPEIIKGTVK